MDDKAKIKELGSKDTTVSTIKKLKTIAGAKKESSENEEVESTTIKKTGIKRKGNHFFSRV